MPIENYIIAVIGSLLASAPAFLAYKILSHLFIQAESKTLNEPLKFSWKEFFSFEFAIIAILSTIAFNILFYEFGLGLKLLLAVIFIYGLILLATVDLKTQYLPDVITIPLIIIGITQGYLEVFVNLQDAIIGGLAGYFTLYVLNLVYRITRGIDGMGGGDFKLLSALGAWVGWQMLPLILLLSSIIGIFVALFIIKLRRENLQAPTPFGPSLAFSGFIAFIYGKDIVNWYLSFLTIAM